MCIRDSLFYIDLVESADAAHVFDVFEYLACDVDCKAWRSVVHGVVICVSPDVYKRQGLYYLGRSDYPLLSVDDLLYSKIPI